jgi:pyruvate formate lyase activating enzyme
MNELFCTLVSQGIPRGDCLVDMNGKQAPACQLTLRIHEGQIQRRMVSLHLSRPENYLSLYQSGCNLACRKCHSHEFTKHVRGEWYAPLDILEVCREYEKKVNLWEPREKATAFHAHDTCRCCGSCVVNGKRSALCPARIEPDKVLLSPQGFGPARNIVAFTGGDLTCRPEFYVQCAELIKAETRLWVLLEVNGYSLPPTHLDAFKQAGIDAFWLDIKAFDDEVHRWLTGRTNRHILGLPEQILKRGFTLEVLSLFIPGVVETDQIKSIAGLLASVDKRIPFTILAFFPEYRMRTYRAPTTGEMVQAFHESKEAGLEKVRLGNTGIFIKTEDDYITLTNEVGTGCF